jgi:chromosome segregation ATPase
LQDRLNRAVATGEYAEAAELQGELQNANEQLAAADAAIAALRAGQAAAQQQHAATTQLIEQARQRDKAEFDLADAREAEADAQATLGECIKDTIAALTRAKHCLASVEKAEEAVNRARQAAWDARRLRGDWAPTKPGPTWPKSNRLAVLLNENKLLAALAAWSPQR